MWSVVGDVLIEEVVASQKQDAALRAVMHPALIKSIADTLLENDDLIVPIGNVVSNYIEKESLRAKRKTQFSGPR